MRWLCVRLPLIFYLTSPEIRVQSLSGAMELVLHNKQGVRLAPRLATRDSLTTPVFRSFSFLLSRLVELLPPAPPHISR
jgi:hypothetical protein